VPRKVTDLDLHLFKHLEALCSFASLSCSFKGLQ